MAMMKTNISSMEEMREMFVREREVRRTMRTLPTQVYQLPCDCPVCAQQLREVTKQQNETAFRYTDRLSRSEAAVLARNLAESLFADLGHVRTAFRSGGELIRRRWLKKSNTKRKTFLKELRPNMCESHDPFNETQIVCGKTITTFRNREILLLPYMTIDVFSKDATKLLRLLHHRICSAPEAWLSGAIAEEFNDGCITMCGETYGTWNSFDKAAVHNGDSYTAPRALLVLEAQASLARFLRDSVTKLLGAEGPTVEEASDKFTRMAVDSRGPSQYQEVSWLPFGMDYYNEPFSPAPTFNDYTMGQLVRIVSEKQMEAKDHLWLLQTDPAYFYKIATYYNKYNLSVISGAKTRKDVDLHQLGVRVILYSIKQLQDWGFLSEELCNVRKQLGTHRDIIKPGRQLPKAYDQALGRLERALIDGIIYMSQRLQERLFASPAWRSMWDIEERLGDGYISVSFDANSTSHLFNCLEALSTIGERPQTAGSKDIAIILKSLDIYLSKCDKSEASNIDAITYSKITDMAAAYNILASICMHRPTPSIHYSSVDEVLQTHDAENWRLLRRRPEINKILCDPRCFSFSDAFSNLDKFRMPIGKKTQEGLDRADQAREALSKVWSAVRENYKKVYRTLDIDAENTANIVKMLSYHDSPELQAMVAREREEIYMKIVQNNASEKLPTAPYRTSIPHASTPSDVAEMPSKVTISAKSKIKTRPSEGSPLTKLQTVLEPKAGLLLDPPRPQHSLPIPKKPRSIDTLRLLFPSATSDLQGTIQWMDFVTTMSELGFHGEHRGGSEWSFQSVGPTGDGSAERNNEETVQSEEDIVRSKRSIVIRQPHPEQKMGAIHLQQIGKRLWRRFGWQRDSFKDL